MTFDTPGFDPATAAADPGHSTRQAFDRLSMSERNWAAVAERIGDAVWVAQRRDDGSTFECVYLSPTLTEWLRPGSGGEARRLRERRLDLGALQVDASPSSRPSTGVRRVGGVVEDVSDALLAEAALRADLETQRKARLEAERLSASKDEFISVVSHDLRSPLNAIRGWAHVLKLSSNLTTAQERALDAIDRNITAQARMVDDLLDSQRILRGKLVLSFGRPALADLVDEAVGAVRLAAENKRIEIDVHHDRSIGSIEADVERLRQILGNLLSNSLKFTPDDGRITVTTACVPSTAADSAVRVTITDSGMGLTPDQLGHVFDPVMRADQPSGRRQGGLNLPLSLARQLVEMHGGRVSASSDGVDAGLSMSIELPTSQAGRAQT